MSVGKGRRPPATPRFVAEADLLAVIGAVLAVVADAWGRVLGEEAIGESQRHDEVTTAGILRRRMVIVERERKPRQPAMKIKPEVGVTAEDQETVVGAIDIEIVYSLGDEPDLRLECKRVSSTAEDDPKALARYYVREGVLRFVGKYGWGQAWGIMIGFVIDGNADGAAALIARYVRKYRNRPAHLISDWAVEPRFGPHRHLFNTRHRKSGGSPIELLHFFLPFPPKPSVGCVR
jgi:hypothetical protein